MADKFTYEQTDWKVPIEQSLLTNTEIDNGSLRLYLILLSYARNKITAFPSRDTLAKDMGCSVRNVDILKNKLKAHGLLSWETKFYGQKKHNTYTLLKYKPITSSYKEKKSSSPQRKKLLINNTNSNNKTTSSDFKKVIKSFMKSYRDTCENIDPDIKRNIQSGWINNKNYIVTNGDRKNLAQYLQENGEDGIEKIDISFKFLKSYLEDRLEYGQFYNSDGSELIPSISLFLKSKIQHDAMMEFTKHRLRVITKELERDES